MVAGATCGERVDARQLGMGIDSGLGPHVAVAKHSYVGPAVVERSTADELVLAYSSPGSVPELRHATAWTAQAHSLPRLPLGAPVWLSVTDISQNLEGLFPGSAIALKMDAHGPLLLGYASGTTTPGLPAVERVDHDSCTVLENPDCPGQPGSSLTYMAAEVRGDQTVVIDDGKTGVVELDGTSYDVVVNARVSKCSGTADFFPPDVTFELRAQNLDVLVAALTPGSPPTCAVGNDDAPGIGAVFRSAGVRQSYEGPVVFQGRDAESQNGYLFHLTENPSGPADDLWLSTDESQLALPGSGAAWWLSSPAPDLMALFDVHGGELQVVTGNVTPPLDAAHGSALRAWLGVAATAEKSCDYGGNDEGGRSSLWSLWDLVLDTSPPVRAHAQTLTPVEIDGVRYEIWVSATAWDTLSFAIFKRPQP